LNNMNNLLLADDYKQKAKLALSGEQWKEALEMYNKARVLDPTNEVIRKETDSLQGLLQAETFLRSGGVSKVFAPLSKWQSSIDAARLFINPGGRLLSFVEKQINQIRFFRILGTVILVVGTIVFLYATGLPERLEKWFDPTPLPTSAPTSIISVPTHTSTVPVNTATPAPETTVPTGPAISETPTIAPSETSSPTPTQQNLGSGYINKATASSWGEPNSSLIERLKLYDPLVLLERTEVGGSVWYRCSWEKDGTTKEGWILADNITFGPPPTPRS
jgi:hypothetical protein